MLAQAADSAISADPWRFQWHPEVWILVAFLTGITDPRGLFVADNVLGMSTVIACLDKKHFAFYRGETSLGLDLHDEVLERQTDRPQTDSGISDDEDYFKNVRGLNRANLDMR